MAFHGPPRQLQRSLCGTSACRHRSPGPDHGAGDLRYSLAAWTADRPIAAVPGRRHRTSRSSAGDGPGPLAGCFGTLGPPRLEGRRQGTGDLSPSAGHRTSFSGDHLGRTAPDPARRRGHGGCGASEFPTASRRPFSLCRRDDKQRPGDRCRTQWAEGRRRERPIVSPGGPASDRRGSGSVAPLPSWSRRNSSATPPNRWSGWQLACTSSPARLWCVLP